MENNTGFKVIFMNLATHTYTTFKRVAKRYLLKQAIFDRKVLKRYFGIETPLYRIWHSQHVKYMQRLLNREHNLEFGNAL